MERHNRVNIILNYKEQKKIFQIENDNPIKVKLNKYMIDFNIIRLKLTLKVLDQPQIL